MKKLLAMLLALVMILSLAACGGSDDAADDGSADAGDTDADLDADIDQPAAPDADIDQPAAPDAPAGGDASVAPDAPSAGSGTVGQILLDDFKGRANSGSAQAIADGILTNSVLQFAGATMPVEPGLLTGFDNAEITGFKEGVMFAPMIGSIPFVGYVFILEDGADANAFMSTLKTNANPRWNICVEAEETVVDCVGNTVFFLMCPTDFEDFV